MEIINKSFIFENDELENGSFYKYTGEATDYAELSFATLENNGKILYSYRYKMWFCKGKTTDYAKEIPYETQWLCFLNNDNTFKTACQSIKPLNFQGF